MTKVYILIDDYTPEAGSTIYGVFATNKLAEARLKELSSDDNEYGESLNAEDTIEILIEDIKE